MEEGEEELRGLHFVFAELKLAVREAIANFGCQGAVLLLTIKLRVPLVLSAPLSVVHDVLLVSW